MLTFREFVSKFCDVDSWFLHFFVYYVKSGDSYEDAYLVDNISVESFDKLVVLCCDFSSSILFRLYVTDVKG